MIAESLSKVCARFGVSTAARNAAMRAVRKVGRTDVFYLLSWEWSEDELLSQEGAQPAIRLSSSELKRACSDPALDLHEEFVDSVQARGDEVWGVIEGGRLIAYQCFSSSISEIPALGAVTFPADRVYVYKAFTVPEARGRKLHRRILVGAACDFDMDNKGGYVTYVNALNTHSLHAFWRVGFTCVGYAIHGWGHLVQLSRVGVGSPWMLVAPDPDLAKQSDFPPAHVAAGICQPPPAGYAVRAGTLSHV